jgi:hypothetical protein
MKRHYNEQKIQKALADHLRARADPKVHWFRPANRGASIAARGPLRVQG